LLQEIAVLIAAQRQQPDLLAHAPACDHRPREIGHLLQVVLRARGHAVVDDLLGRAPAQRVDDPGAQIEILLFV